MDTQMIVLDLEWNRGYDNKPLEEILQIGAVRLDRLGGRILDTFDIRIKPCVHKRFNRAAKALPEAESYQRATVRFPEALRRFLDWCGEETEFAGWGSDDFLTLRQNCAYWKVPVPKLPRVYDLQAAFSLLLGPGSRSPSTGRWTTAASPTASPSITPSMTRSIPPWWGPISPPGTWSC